MWIWLVLDAPSKGNASFYGFVPFIVFFVAWIQISEGFDVTSSPIPRNVQNNELNFSHAILSNGLISHSSTEHY